MYGCLEMFGCYFMHILFININVEAISNEVYIVHNIAYVKDSGTLRIFKERDRRIREMTTIQPFEPVDLFKTNNVNLDILTENFPLEFYFEYMIIWPDLFFKSSEMTVDPTFKHNISGYMMAKTEGKTTEWHTHITAVTVAPRFRRISLASKLCNTLETMTDVMPHEVNFIDLFVKCNNQLAIKLYEKLGYSVYRRVVGYYNSAEDGYPDTLKKVDDNKDAFDMRKAMARDRNRSVRPDGRSHKCYPHDVRF
ncbi:AVB_G0056140.mRNA.1.CDS.1 [Saccharomyces cerevisiae]|nr:CPG_1a_G0056890.mRNA.1.CDS.1 [Saccharomyces cerevisiae]CAI4849246.1 AVB_G0056140.mRNA.1.CDS.1 [Saccharomyces cerevisiae]CAI7388104.1 AVB_G0056140.mRNA.1.CDS.1 [Saccharomyces cerevisiae]CAI7487634.1 CPG_1a_G0056890.mRNA.1.CDS.1 [Saccharomyces cerevisiae]